MRKRISFWLSVIAVSCIFAGTQKSEAAPDSPSTNEIRAITWRVHSEVTNAMLGGNPKLMQLLLKPVPANLQVPLAAESKGVSAGVSLPSFFLNPRTPGRDESDILTGARFGATSQEVETSIRWLMVIPTLAQKGSTEFVGWLDVRSNNLPPASSDLILSVALGEGGVWEKESEDFWKATKDRWNRMLRAKNPIYRLSAFYNLSRFEKDRSRKLDACKLALHERNTIFQFWALEELEQMPGPDSAEVIEAFIKNGADANDGTLGLDLNITEVAKEALVKCRAK